jgi:hypothetical protein
VQREGHPAATGESRSMLRFCALAFATLLLALPVPAFAQAQAAVVAGGLAGSGLQALKLVLLGFVLLLVGARLRVVARARRARLHEQGYFTATAEAQPRLAPDGLPEAAPAASSFTPPVGEHEDPEPQPAGALPSTATAKRKAGELRRPDEHRGG